MAHVVPTTSSLSGQVPGQTCSTTLTPVIALPGPVARPASQMQSSDCHPPTALDPPSSTGETSRPDLIRPTRFEISLKRARARRGSWVYILALSVLFAADLPQIMSGQLFALASTVIILGFNAQVSVSSPVNASSYQSVYAKPGEWRHWARLLARLTCSQHFDHGH